MDGGEADSGRTQGQGLDQVDDPTGGATEDSRQEAIIRRNVAASASASASPESLSHIIRAAILQSTDDEAAAARERERAAREAAASAASYAAAIARAEASITGDEGPPIAASDSASVSPQTPAKGQQQAQAPSPSLESPQPPPPSGSGASPRPAPLPLANTTITMGRLVKLLQYFIFCYSKNAAVYRSSAKSLVIQQRVGQLCELDYFLSRIHNDSKNGVATNLAAAAAAAVAAAEQNGGGASGSSTGALSAAADAGFEYCSSYPLELLVFENERTGPFGLDATASALGTVASRVNDAAVLKPLFRLSRFSRVHGRFVVPVIVRDAHTNLLQAAERNWSVWRALISVRFCCG
jgi:hypothetical protein